MLPLLAPVLPFVATQLGRIGLTSAARYAMKLSGGKFVSTAAQRIAPSFATRALGAGAGVAVVGGGAATVAGVSSLGTLFTVGFVLTGVLAVGVVGYGIYKMMSSDEKNAEQVAAENPPIAQALAPALQPQFNMPPMPMMPQPMMMPPYPMMQGGMIPNAAYATQAYPAAVVGMPQMMQAAPANEWQERVGPRPMRQGSYVQSLTDPAAIAAMNNQQIQ